MDLTPIYRIEYFLDAIINGTTPPTPLFRVEYYLAKIAGADVEIPEPIYRIEYYLAKLCGEAVEIPTPLYRIEYYLAKLCGEDVEIPDPIYRVEFWLFEWCGGGGIEKTIIGNPIHITDALAKPVQALSVAIEPIQDLHGYDNPWPAGGGKNIFPNSLAETKTYNGITIVSDGMGKYTISGTATAYGEIIFDLIDEFTIPVSISGGGSGCLYLNNSFVANANEFLPAFMYNNIQADSWTLSATNKVSSTYTAMSNKQCNKIRFTFYADVSISGTIAPMISNDGSTNYDFAPYSNICPIYGHTDADVVRTGKNLLDNTGMEQTVANLRIARHSGYGSPILLKAGVTYTFYCNSETNATSLLLIVPFTSTNIAEAYNTNKLTYTPTEDVYVGVNFYWVNDRPADATNLYCVVGSDIGGYSPYVGTTYPIPLGTTVYGGTLDVTSGKLTVTMAMVDLGTLSWTKENNHFYSGVVSAAKTPTANTVPANLVCSAYKNTGAYYVTQEQENGTIGLNNSRRLYVYDTAFADTAVLSGVYVVYELATPTTIQLTPQQVELLQGENNVWSDGTMTLVYLADGNASDVEALNILLGGRYTNTHEADEPTDREALDIVLGGKK